MKNRKAFRTGVALATTSLFSCIVSAQITVFQEDFESFTAGTEYKKDFNVSLGGNTFPDNYKEVSYGQWGITNNGNDFSDGVLQPQTGGDTATNLKMAGVFLEGSDVFSPGNGTYTVSFEMTGDTDPDSHSAAQAFVFGGSGVDFSGDTNDQLDLELSTGGFGGYNGLQADEDLVDGSDVSAAQLGNLDFGNQAVEAGTQVLSFDFTYSGEESIAFAVGGYDNGFQVDNLAITTVPEPSTYAALFGIGALVLVLARRRFRNCQ